jgi:hypothetical protein
MGRIELTTFREASMKGQTFVVTMFALMLAVPVFGGDKKHSNRAMIEKMEAVPCGAKERGLTGLGSVFASVGATRVDSDEKLCPVYLLRTDDMEYQIRPVDHKHPVVLPVGKEGEFKISKDVMEMRVPDGDRKKRRYQVVGMKPIEHTSSYQSDSKYDSTKSKYDPASKDYGKPVTDRTAAGTLPVKPADPNVPPQ